MAAPAKTHLRQRMHRLMEAEVANLTLQVARPLNWHERTVPFPKAVDGATCFFLRLDGGVVGITANHVVQSFERAQEKSPLTVCQISASRPFDLLGAIIARDEDLDLATFAAPESLVQEANAVPLDCRGSWPPPVPDEARALSVCGYPLQSRSVSPQGIAESAAWGGLVAVEYVTGRDIIFTFDPDRDIGSALAPIPELGLDLSGCSGGPALMHGTRNGLHRWFPVGLIVSGSRGQGTRLIPGVDMYYLRRIDFIRPDGTIGGVRAGL